jgi:hypothetical protein
MAAPVPHRAPLSVGDQRVLFFVRGARVVRGGGGTAPLALRLPIMQAIVQDSCAPPTCGVRVTVRRGGSPCPY